MSIRHQGKEVARGSAFLVAPGVALTAWHVLLDERGKRRPGACWLVFERVGVEATVAQFDAQEDWALLDCPTELAIEPVRLARAPGRGDVWSAWGAFVDSDGLRLPTRGTVEHPDARINPNSTEDDAAFAIVLYCAQAAAGNGLDVHGMSGAPCVVDGAVVGLIRNALNNQAGRTVGGTLFACAIERVASKSARLPRLDPCDGLPGYEQTKLPDRPYRYLEAYGEADADLFFGRCREIHAVLEKVESRAAHVILVHGQSGVGKSSLLRAGLIPRLRANATTTYLRAPSLEELIESFGSVGDPADSLRAAWSAKEKADQRDVIVILDQVEEYFTRDKHATANELARVLDALTQSKRAGGTCAPARGIAILSFRKEWLAEVVTQCEKFDVGFAQTPIWTLDFNQVAECVGGIASTERLRQKYGVVVATGLAHAIAHDLVDDKSSPVGPVLQIALTRMWETASKTGVLTFDTDAYRAAKVGLRDFLAQQLAAVSADFRQEVDSGLALDLLRSLTTELGTTASRHRRLLDADYGEATTRLGPLLERLKGAFLVTTVEEPRSEGEPEALRLCHDTLAPVVRQAFARSQSPGQRARRLLDFHTSSASPEGAVLTGRELRVVRTGGQGMSTKNAAERRLVARSMRARRLRLIAGGIVLIAALAVGAYGARQGGLRTWAAHQVYALELSRLTEPGVAEARASLGAVRYRDYYCAWFQEMQGGAILHPGVRRTGITVPGRGGTGQVNGSALVVRKNSADRTVQWFWHTGRLQSIVTGQQYTELAGRPHDLPLRPFVPTESIESIALRVREHDRGDGQSLTGSFATLYEVYRMHRYLGLPLGERGTDNCPTSVVIEARDAGYAVSGMPNRRCVGEVEGVRDVLVLVRSGSNEQGEFGTGVTIRQSTQLAQFQPTRGCLDVR